MAIYHIISVFRNIQWSNMAARSCDPEEFLDAHKYATLAAHNPRGHTIGIVGLGSIGYLIATKVYRCFGAKILYNDIYPKSAAQEAAIEATRVEDLNEMLAACDCVILATPGTGGKKLMDASRFQSMKRGSRFVNIARGTLVDENALVEALESGHIAAAGLDVHENEPQVNSRLANMRNVTLTSHTAGAALETWYQFEALAMRNVEAVLQGKKPLTPVNEHLFKD
jgi:lactate dehydrogenase-like 2-hydroxyacid dehydrogenase